MYNQVTPVTMLSQVILLLLLNTCTAEDTTKGHINYVRPTNVTTCPPHTQPCHTLEQYVGNTSEYFKSNTIFYFLSGLHDLHTHITIKDIVNMTLTSNSARCSTQKRPIAIATVIHCEQGVGSFGFFNITNLTIDNLKFVSCGNESKCSTLLFNYVFNLNVSNLEVDNSTGYGLLGLNVLGNSFISYSLFKHNKGTIEPDCPGGNAAFWYMLCGDHVAVSTLTVAFSKFLFGYDNHTHAQISNAAGFNLRMGCYNVQVKINNVTFYGNKGHFGGNIHLYYFVFGNSSVLINNSYIAYGNSQYKGGAFLIETSGHLADYDRVACGPMQSIMSQHLLHISNTVFFRNRADFSAGAFYFDDFETPGLVCAKQIVTIEGCKFIENHLWAGYLGGAAVHLALRNHLPGTPSTVQVTIKNTSFLCNWAVGNQLRNIQAVVTIEGLQNTTFIDCVFEDNILSALLLFESSVIFEGNNTFRKNTGLIGGGLILIENSFMYLTPHVNIQFINNHALTSGGTIFVDTEEKLPFGFPCFFQVDVDILFLDFYLQKISITYANNTAEVAGSFLYGGRIDHCDFFQTGIYGYAIPGRSHFKEIFHCVDNCLDFSVISSDPFGICFCMNNTPDCNIKMLNKSVYPGQPFLVEAVAVGQFNGTVPGVVVATFVGTTTSAFLGTLQSSQNINVNSCSPLSYTVYSSSANEVIQFTAEKPSYVPFVSLFTPPTISVNLDQCPLGFVLSNNSRKCECDPVLAKYGLVCFIATQTILRPPKSWIGNWTVGRSNSTTLESSKDVNYGVLFQRYCPYNYCSLKRLNITLNNTDKQCVHNHSGILCGQCREGYSLTLGSSVCKNCSNWNIFLVCAFAMLGVMLVAFLILCNLTVSDGSLNGLIFYANVIWVNQSIFFPAGDTNILTVFMAWLNLDLGIETCFYNGMDAYAKAWLQFAFPIYIWLLTGTIIISSRKWKAAANVIGRNAVKVLATLFLLSYAKLQRTIITILSFTYLTYPDESKRYVWLYDGNVQYFGGKHLPLFATALLVFMFVVLPYTIVLTFLPCLQKKSDFKVLFWVNKLKPLFDAYMGPYKDKYRFWTGFILMVRNALFLVFAFNTLGESSLNIMVTAFVSLLLMMLTGWLHGIYRSWPCDILEIFFYFNLGAVSVATQYTVSSNQSQAAIIYCSTGISFCVFTIIALYHTYHQVSSTTCYQSLVQKWLAHQEPLPPETEPLLREDESSSESETDMQPEQRQAVLRFNEMNELVLEYDYCTNEDPNHLSVDT